MIIVYLKFFSEMKQTTLFLLSFLCYTFTILAQQPVKNSQTGNQFYIVNDGDVDSCNRNPQRFSFAWLSDIHFNSFAYAAEDIKEAIAEINTADSINFVIISGDLAEFGATQEFADLKQLLSELRKPLYMTTGNHDVNWSENGCTAYEKFFGPTHFLFEAGGIRFIGCGAGPMLRMGAPCVPREEVEWLRSVLDTTSLSTPIIFVNHFPMDVGVTNSEEILKLLRSRNIQFVMCGHEHRNSFREYLGVESVIGRSSLRRKDPSGGYNIVTVENGKVEFRERLTGRVTKPVWHSFTLKMWGYCSSMKRPHIEEVWRIEESSDIASQGVAVKNLYVYTTTSGYVRAVDIQSGKLLWSYKTGNKIFSAPFITSENVYITSADGKIYALKRRNGKERWSLDTGYPIVASPLVHDDVLLTGSSNGKFYAVGAGDGKIKWVAEGLRGYVESRPAADENNVYIGSWGAMFYAFDLKTGKRVWEFDTGKGRYFSPGACWPVVAHGEIFVQSSDYVMRAFSSDGKIVWQTNSPKGREAIAFSADLNTLFVQGIGNNITAFDLSREGYPQLWVTYMPYESNFIPTRSGIVGDLVLIPSAFGVVYAIGSDGTGLKWEYKLSNSAITSFCNVACSEGKRSVVVMTMDGTVARLKF